MRPVLWWSRVSILVFAAQLVFAPATFGKTEGGTKTIIFYVKVGPVLDTTAKEEIVILEKLSGKVKLGGACTGSEGTFQVWSALSADPTGIRTPQLFDLAANGIPATGARISAIQVGATCTEAGATWIKYTGAIE